MIKEMIVQSMSTKTATHFSEHNKTEDKEICPHLKLRNDETTRYGYSHVSNFCHKPKKAQPVKLSYQESDCLNGNHRNCPVFQMERIKQLPRDIRGKNIFKRRILRVNPLLIIALFLVLVIILFLIISTSQLVLPSQDLSNNSTTLSNSGIPVTGSEVLESDQISPLRLKSVINFELLRNSNFLAETILNQREDASKAVFSVINDKNLNSTVVSQTTLRTDYVYGLNYLKKP